MNEDSAAGGLAEPVNSGPVLLAEIASSSPAPNELAIWALGQSGLIIKSSAGVLVIDPYLSDHLTRKYRDSARPHVRMVRTPLAPRDLTFVGIALATHKHSDHLDPETMPAILEASPGCRLVVPAAIADHAVAIGAPPDRVVPINAGETFSAHGFRIRALPSAHEGLDTDRQGRYLNLGFVIEAAGLRLYHSGDSLAYQGLTDWLGPDPFDVLFLPINGRDSQRGVPGNMTGAEAIELANRILPRFIVPMHYDMFTFNCVDVDEFLESPKEGLAPRVKAKALACGAGWVLGGRE